MKRIKYIFLLLGVISIGSAHKVNIFAYVEGKQIFTQSYYSNGKPIVSGIIEVFNARDMKLLDGETDKNGEFSFLIPEKTELKIILNAGMGHRAETVIKEKDIPTIEKPPKKKVTSKPAIITENPKTDEYISKEDIKDIVEQVIEQKMRPLFRILAQRQRTISFVDVIGGIGYIIGIMGLIMYLKSKKK